MAKLTRIPHKVFGLLADWAYQMGKFGSFKNGSPSYASDAAEVQSLPNFEEGLFASLVGDGAPFAQDMNAALHHSSRQLGYLFQQGIAEWDSLTTYYIGSVVVSGDTIYISTVDNNLGNIPDASATQTKWQSVYGPAKKSFYIPKIDGNFSNGTNPSSPQYNSARICYNGFAYLIGGFSPLVSSPYQGSWVAPILSNGLLGAWTGYFGSDYPARSNVGAFIAKGKMFLLGGVDNSNAASSLTCSATINPDGSLGTFTSQGNLSTAATGIKTFVYGSYVYALGWSSTVLMRALINNDGTLGAWSNYAVMPYSEVNGDWVMTSSYIHFIGKKKQTARLYSDGTISAFIDDGSFSSATDVNKTRNILISRTVYSISSSNFGDIQIAEAYINDDGRLESPYCWTTSYSVNGVDGVILTNKHVFLQSYDVMKRTTLAEQIPYLGEDLDSSPLKPQPGMNLNGIIKSKSVYQKLNNASWEIAP